MSTLVVFLFFCLLTGESYELGSKGDEESLGNYYIDDEGLISSQTNHLGQTAYVTQLFRGLCQAKCLNQKQVGLPELDEENEILTLGARCFTPTCFHCLRCGAEGNGSSCINLMESYCFDNGILETKVKDHIDKNIPIDFTISSLPPLRPILHCSTFQPNSSSFDVYFRLEFPKHAETLGNLSKLNALEIPRVFVIEKNLNGVLKTDEIPTLTDSWLISVNIPSNVSFRIRVTPIAPNRIYPPILSLPFILTPSAERGVRRSPKNLKIQRIRQNPMVDSHADLQVLLHWDSGMGNDATCRTLVWVLEDSVKTFEIKQANHTFWFYFTNQTTDSSIHFDRNYTVHIEEFSDVTVDAGSNGTDFVYSLPPCLEFFKNNFSMCPPPPPQDLQFQILSNNSVLASWNPPKNTSTTNLIEKYELRLYKFGAFYSPKGVALPTTALHYHPVLLEDVTIPGNITTYTFANISHSGVVKVVIRAFTRGGVSIVVNKGPNSIQEISESIVAKIAIACSILLFITAITGSVIYLKIQKDKRVRHKARAKYCGDDKDVNCKIESSYFPPYCSKWLIETNCLKMGDLIGEGNFGHVHAATLFKFESTRIVAVKTLKEGVHLGERSKFWEEFHILKSLESHPHVIRLIGIVKAHYPTLVVEYCDGGDLHTYLKKLRDEKVRRTSRAKRKLKWMSSGTISGEFLRYSATNSSDKYGNTGSEDDGSLSLSMVTNEAYFSKDEVEIEKMRENIDVPEFNQFVSFGRQVAAGMEFLSNNKIVHRDLAARNILVIHEPKPILKIADFGLSRDVYEKNWYKKSSNDKIPFKWLALECLLDEVYTTKSDVWSYGVLLWEIVTYGGSPYPGINNTDIFDFLKRGFRMSQPDNCPRDLYIIMRKCWEKESDDRPEFGQIRRLLDNLMEKSYNGDYFLLRESTGDMELSDKTIDLQETMNSMSQSEESEIHYEQGLQFSSGGHRSNKIEGQSTYDPSFDILLDDTNGNVKYSTLAPISCPISLKNPTDTLWSPVGRKLSTSAPTCHNPILNCSENIIYYSSQDTTDSNFLPTDVGQSPKSSSSTSLYELRIPYDRDGGNETEIEPRYANDSLFHPTIDQKTLNTDGFDEFDMRRRDEEESSKSKTFSNTITILTNSEHGKKKVAGISNFLRNSSSIQFGSAKKWLMIKNNSANSNKTKNAPTVTV